MKLVEGYVAAFSIGSTICMGKQNIDWNKKKRGKNKQSIVKSMIM